MISVVIPAHNEQNVLSRCLAALLADAKRGEFEVVVVCNGCDDDTAQVARSFGDAVQVCEIPVASKVAALNEGDARVSGFPRFYVDADIVMGTQQLRELATALDDQPLMAAAPRTVVDLNGASLGVRAFYSVWQRTPYYQQGMIGCGVYALTECARSRFGNFPDLIADDGYVRALYSGDERGTVGEASATIYAPRTIPDLIKAKTRSRLGVYQLQSRFPDLIVQDQREKHYGAAIWRVLTSPDLWLSIPFYVAINFAARIRARRQLSRIADYTWERDDSTRTEA